MWKNNINEAIKSRGEEVDYYVRKLQTQKSSIDRYWHNIERHRKQTMRQQDELSIAERDLYAKIDEVAKLERELLELRSEVRVNARLIWSDWMAYRRLVRSLSTRHAEDG